MIDTYIKKAEFVRAVRLDPNSNSIDECVAFVVGAKVRHVEVNFDWGIKIETLSTTMNATYGTYIVKDANENFHVFSSEAFNACYIKLDAGNPPYTVQDG